MRLRRTALFAVAAVLAGLTPQAAARPLAPLDPYLAAQLGRATATTAMQVFVHGHDAGSAQTAAAAAGLEVLGRFDSIDAVLARGTAADVHRARRTAGVEFVEADRPIEWHLDTSHEATMGNGARRGGAGVPGVDGSGVTIAIIDSGIDGTHPFFLDDEGESKVVRNVRTACPVVGVFVYHPACWIDEVVRNDTDTHGTSGHGTHVAGIAAGYDVTTTPSTLSPRPLDLHGAAPGAKLVGVSVSSGPSMASGVMGLTWVRDNHANPCLDRTCPPIKVVNNSWGPVGGSAYCPQCGWTKLTEELVELGVVVVWSAGNGGGDGSGKDATGRSLTTNGHGKSPRPGVLMVASYDDDGSGTRDGTLSSFSSRAEIGDELSYPDLAAPGSNTLSSCRPHLPTCDGSLGADGPGPTDKLTFTWLSGTSMAAPHVSGIVAQLLQANPHATPAQVEWALVTTAYKFGGGYGPTSRWGSTTSFDKGAGLVDAAAAVRAITSSRLPSDESLQPPEPPDSSDQDDEDDEDDEGGRDR